MFAQGNYQPTYYGPIVASGDLIRRMRSSGMAQAEFQGAQRAFTPQKFGIGAGSGLMQYQGGIEGDAKRAQGYAAAQQAFGDYGQNIADATLKYQQGAADEQAGLRSLRTQQRTINQGAALDMRKIDLDRQISEYQRAAQNEANKLKNKSSVAGGFLGLISR